MEKEYYLKLAKKGLRIPIAADLVLHQNNNYSEIISNGRQLGQVLEETATRYRNPFAIPLMDLTLEKSIIMKIIGINDMDIGSYHFGSLPTDEILQKVNDNAGKFLTTRMSADIDAINYIAENTDLIPVGMSIGPFSLLTKLISDPITSVYLAGSGLTAEDDDEVKMLEKLLDLSTNIIIEYINLKIEAGAKSILIAEPAANLVFFSPNQLESGSTVFDRYVIEMNRKIKRIMNEKNVSLIFHCCGELNDKMLLKFAGLDPAILTLGGSRVLWEDAKIIPKDIILFGNIPSKKFYSDSEISIDEVKKMSRELLMKMEEENHPFILGTECDVLHVPGAEEIISSKVEAMMSA